MIEIDDRYRSLLVDALHAYAEKMDKAADRARKNDAGAVPSLVRDASDAESLARDIECGAGVRACRDREG